MFDFTEIDRLNKFFKSLLEDQFLLVYIEDRVVKKEGDKNTDDNHLHLFKITKSRSSIFEKITSVDALDDVKDEIKNAYKGFSDNFLDYFDRVDGELKQKHRKSFEIIEKMIKSRAKKLSNTVEKFGIEGAWGVSKMQEEFYFSVQKNLEDILDNLLPTISTGMRESNAYNGVLNCLNEFLSKLGVYTLDIDMNKECDYNTISPQNCEDCETDDGSKKDMIKELISYPYVLNEEQVIMEGKVMLWKVVHNG
ncbi:MAG: hypothetical protein Q9O24_02330 [Gammaproteobacteria bacterium]|nr:hypothetical protein [Gammaproteobacteria bacterium]